jgi:hypothetical protein
LIVKDLLGSFHLGPFSLRVEAFLDKSVCGITQKLTFLSVRPELVEGLRDNGCFDKLSANGVWETQVAVRVSGETQPGRERVGLAALVALQADSTLTRR